MEPVTAGAAIGALVTLMGKWLNYDIEKRKLEQQGRPAPQPDAEAQKGQQVAQVVEQGITQYGNEDEQADLESFTRKPERYADMMQRVLRDLAQRNPTFAQQLQRVAEQTNVAQTGGVRGTANVHGDNYGQSTGVNTGTMSQTNTGRPPKKRDD